VRGIGRESADFFLAGGGSGDLPLVVCGEGNADAGPDDAWAIAAAISALLRAAAMEIPESADSARAAGGFFGGGGLVLVRSESFDAGDSVRAPGGVPTFFFGSGGAEPDTCNFGWLALDVARTVRAGFGGRALMAAEGGLRGGPRAFRGSGGIGAPPPLVTCGLEA